MIDSLGVTSLNLVMEGAKRQQVQAGLLQRYTHKYTLYWEENVKSGMSKKCVLYLH